MSNSPRSALLPSPPLTSGNDLAGSDRRSSQQTSPRLVIQPYEPDEEDDRTYVEPAADELVAPTNFNPFFTVIEESTSGEHYHPSVHYIFSDDDQEILTTAAVRELGYDDTADVPREDDGSGAIITILPPARPGVKERYMVLDIGSDGRTVNNIQSMNKDWRVVETAISPAPTWSAGNDSEEGALMLKISGVEVSHVDPADKLNGSTVFTEARHEATGNTLVALDALAEKFEKELGAVTKLLNDDQMTNQSSTIRARGASISGEVVAFQYPDAPK